MCTQWLKACTYADDIIDIALEDPSSLYQGKNEQNIKKHMSMNGGNDNVSDPPFEPNFDEILHQASSLIEINFDLGVPVKLILLRKAVVTGEEATNFEITFETIESEHKKSNPKGIHVVASIKGEKLSAGRTQVDTSYSVNHNSSLLTPDLTEHLSNCFKDSLDNIPLIVYEKVLQKNLSHFVLIQQNSIKKHHYEGKEEVKSEEVSGTKSGAKNGAKSR